MSEIQKNLSRIKQQIKSLTAAAGREAGSVRLLAVSKTKSMELIREAFEAGQRDFGENKVQELREKHPLLPEAHWHIIGHLQRNKVKYIAPFAHLVHSVDSERLLQEIDKQAANNDRQIDCLLQLNISEEDAKSGLDEAKTQVILNKIDNFPNIRILGLMGMAAFSSDRDLVSSQFSRLKKAFDVFAKISHPRIQMQELSMGMSGDFDLAIQAGATIVRIGSAVFGGRL